MSTTYVEQREGVYRVAGTRVSLDSIVYAFIPGQSAESIAQSFPVLTLEQGIRRDHLLPRTPGGDRPLPRGPRAGLRGQARGIPRGRPEVLPEAGGREETPSSRPLILLPVPTAEASEAAKRP